jgi:site-specific recombinase XerD
MPRTATRTTEDLAVLADSFELSLRATKSAKTVAIYLTAVRALDAYLAAQGMPRNVGGIRREHVEAFFGDLTERGWRPATRNQTHRSLVQFWKWAIDQDEIRESPMRHMKAPRIPEAPVNLVRPEHQKALLAACRGKGFADIRDKAILSLFYDGGLRRGEMAGLQLDDLDLKGRTARVTGKAGHTRHTRFTPTTALALDRYLRARHRYLTERGRADRYGAPKALWWGEQGRALGVWGLTAMVYRRAEEAGLKGQISPHAFRHGWAHAMLRNGAQPGDVRSLAGWKSDAMLSVYARTTAAERALANYDGHGPMDKLDD